MNSEKQAFESTREVLVVDDAPANLQLLFGILTEGGYQVRSAVSGQLALDTVAAKVPDLILLDVRMPEMDGFEVCRRLKAKDQTRDVPIIFVSAAEDIVDKVKGFGFGGVDYVTKPFQAAEVLARVKTHLDLSRLHTELENQVRRRTAELELANQELRESEDRYRSLVEQGADAIFVTDMEGNILEVNRQACQSLGYTRETLLDLNIADVDTEVLSHEHRKRFWEQVTDGQPVTFEGTQKRKDGSTFPVEVRMALLAAGPTRKILAFVRNLTERKKAEQERITLIATLESQNAELERFTYTVSHDLRSPLITINGYVGMLRQDLAEGDSKQVEEDLSRISNATDKMDHLLRDVLELSRIGRLVNASVEVSMGNLVREAIESVNGQLQESGVQVEIAPALPVVFGDRLRLTEMLQNLIDNAVKYMGDQPEPRIDIGWRRDGDETVFYVRDNGIGINPRYHEKVFGLFDQLNQKMNGSGIGLALARRIVEVHGGRLWVESEGPGHGSTFCFTIAPKDESTQRLDRERSTNSR